VEEQLIDVMQSSMARHPAAGLEGAAEVKGDYKPSFPFALDAQDLGCCWI